MGLDSPGTDGRSEHRTSERAQSEGPAENS